MSVTVTFVSIYGENRQLNSICETRCYEPHRTKREKPLELLGLHHKLLPVEKMSSDENVDNWNYKPVANYKMYSGPVSDRKTKAIFYICTSRLCLIQCPCVSLRALKLSNLENFRPPNLSNSESFRALKSSNLAVGI